MADADGFKLREMCGQEGLIGGRIVVIKPTPGAPVLGPSTNNPAGDWRFHVVVVKESRVYGFTGRNGLPIGEFKSQFQYRDAIVFGF